MYFLLPKRKTNRKEARNKIMKLLKIKNNRNCKNKKDLIFLKA